MTHEHEPRGWNGGGRDGAGWRGRKGRKKWDNYNSIINKILKNFLNVISCNLYNKWIFINPDKYVFYI